MILSAASTTGVERESTMKSKRLTQKEITICESVWMKLKDYDDHQMLSGTLERDADGKLTGNLLGFCWLIGQRVTILDSRFLYHEGYLTGAHHHARADGKFPHAWNTLNGKLVDFSAFCSDGVHITSFKEMHGLAKWHKAEHTYTAKQVCTALTARKMWDWISDVAAS